MREICISCDMGSNAGQKWRASQDELHVALHVEQSLKKERGNKIQLCIYIDEGPRKNKEKRLLWL